MTNKKGNRKITIIVALVLLIIVGAVSYAFFQAQLGEGKIFDTSILSKTTDSLTFSDCGPVKLSLNQINFADGEGNLSDDTCVTAILRANNNTNSATIGYNVFAFIYDNNFIYTTNNNTPEIIMSVTDPTGNPITSLPGLSYVTSGGVSGFDVTTQSGLIQIASNYTITSNSSTTPTRQTWNVTFTAINLSTNQSANSTHTFKAKIVISHDQFNMKVPYENCTNPSVTNRYFLDCDTNLLACRVAQNFNFIKIAESPVVLHDGIILDESNSCAVLDAEDESYRFTGGDYDVTQKAINAGYNYVNTYSGNTTGGVIGVNCNGTNWYVGCQDASCSTKYYYLLYDTNVTQYATYDAAASQAITDGYLINKNLNNYVCFGYDTSVPANATTCPEQNLYRIIGAFDDDNDGNYNVKLIKADYASTTEFGTNAQNGTSSYSSNYTSSWYTGYKGTQSSVNRFIWYGSSSNYSNRWDNSTFRSGVLNNYYLNTYLGNTWKNMIEETTYYLGGPEKTGYTSYVPKDLYSYERNPALVYDTTTYPSSIDDYIGLMYISDYGYASKTSTWSTSTNASYIRASGNDWVYNGIYEWTITPKATTYFSAINVNDNGIATGTSVDYGYAVRPVFYLKSDVEVASGSGTKSDPYYLDYYTFDQTYNYSANVQTVQIAKGGYYKLEVWGAAGATRGTNYGTAGNGGYSVGVIHLNTNDNLYIHTGGKGTTAGNTGTATGGGVNGGGGAKYYGGGGGGGTDIRINTDSLYARVIVAGGGGGAQGRSGTNYRGNGGAGGGTEGANGTYQNGSTTNYYGHGGTATAGGSTYTSGTASYRGTAGTFGQGGNGGARSSSYGGCGGGGGGWYGGGGGYYRYAGGGGGSGYVYTADTASQCPTGCLLTEEYQMTSANTYDGTTANGNANDGYAKVTYCGKNASDCS